MPSVKWHHCCENFGQCCVYLLLAKPKDLKSPFAFQEIATVTHPKRKFEYGFSHRPQHSPGSSKAQDDRLKTFLYSPQEKPVHTAPSTPKTAVKHVTTSSVVVKQPFRPQRQASYYNEVYAMEGDKWGREYCRTSYCSIMPSSKWTHCCDNYRKCCAYVYHTQGKDVKNPFAYEEISIFSIPLRPPRIRPIHRMSTTEVQADEPQTSTPGPPDEDQLLPEGPQPPAAGETPQGSPAPKPQPWRDHKPDNRTEGPQLSKERTPDRAPGPQTLKEQTPEDPQPTDDRRLRYDVDQGTAEVGTESPPIVVPLTSDSPVLDRALVTFNDVVAKEEAKRCRPRYCAILSPDQWRSCCSRYRQCCAYARYLEPRGPFYFEEDPMKIH
nr:uncharacterized protein LOC113826797 [Penaeus vannamei]